MFPLNVAFFVSHLQVLYSAMYFIFDISDSKEEDDDGDRDQTDDANLTEGEEEVEEKTQGICKYIHQLLFECTQKWGAV